RRVVRTDGNRRTARPRSGERRRRSGTMAAGISRGTEDNPMTVQRIPMSLTSVSVLILLMASPAGAEIVFDPSVYARQFEQLTELKKQVDTLTSQLRVAQDQLTQAKQLYDSF